MGFSVCMRAQTVSIQQSPEGSTQFLINFELPSPFPGLLTIADDACQLTVYVTFRYYDVNDVLLEEIEKPIEVYSNDGNLPFFSTKDFMYNYSAESCNANAHHANIYIYACGYENCFTSTILQSLSANFNGGTIGLIDASVIYGASCNLDAYLNTPNPSNYVISIEQIPVTPTTIPLSAAIHLGLGICSTPMVQQIYAVPSCGCPPYSIIRYNDLGQPIAPFAPLNYFGTYTYFATFNMPASIPQMIAATPGNYTAIITDGVGTTVNIPYTLNVQTMTSNLYYPPLNQPYINATTQFCYVNLALSNVYGQYQPTYLWSNGSTTYFAQTNAPGSFTATVTYANGCIVESNTYTVEETDFFIPDVVGDSNGEYRISAGTTEVWNTDKKVNATVVIENGATLSIENNNVRFLNSVNSIRVLNGGILRINNASLKPESCNPFWQGIRVEGNWDIDHPSDYYTNGSPNHGTVIIENGTQIANAWVGVHAYDMADVVGANMGGGIVHIDGSANGVIFLDNATDVQLDRFYGLQHGIIKKCVFNRTNATYFAAYSGSNNEHVVLNRCGNVFIYDNQFQNLSTQPLTCIKAVNTNLTIGIDESGNIKPNKFSNYTNGPQTKGIDIYNTLTAASVTNVIGNEFTGIQKCITLNNVPFAVVTNNSFELPAGNTPPNDTYGVYAYKSFGFEVANNTFTADVGNNHTRAMVVNRAFFDADVKANIRQNQFKGAFRDATRFEEDCRSLHLNCNVYLNEPQRNWYIAPYAELETQGVCSATKPELSFHQHWYYLPSAIYAGYSNYHVYNDNPNFTLEIYRDDYEFSVPTYNEGNVDEYSCSSELGVTIGENPSCTIPVPPYDDGIEGCAYSGEELSRKIQNWQRAGETDSIIALLHCVAQDWSYKILVGTYIDRRMYPQALATLDSIPNTPQGNADFKAIYTAYIQLLTGGSGKNSDAAFALQQAEQTRTHTQQTLAESMFALLYGNDYVRSITDKSGYGSINSAAKPTFTLVPNPANNNVALYWQNALVVSSDVYVTDIAGRILKSHKNIQNGQQISTDNLPNGIYYVHAATLSATQKLVVIH